MIGVEEGVAEDGLREIVHPFVRDCVGDPLRDEDGDHVREDVFEFTRQFEHDDTQGDGHAGDTREEGGGADHGEDARGDGRDKLADEAAKESAGVEGRDDDARGDFGAEGYGGEEEFGEGAVDKIADVSWLGGERFLVADPGGGRSGRAAVLKEVLDDFVAWFTGQWIGVLEEARDEDDEEDFEDRMILYDAVLSERL